MSILIIGGIDVSDYVEVGYTVNTEPIYEDVSFVNVLKNTVQKLVGTKVSLSATISGLSAELATSVCKACNIDNLNVTYAAPVKVSATFKRPSVSSTLVTETPEEWDIQISMETDTVPLDGL